jgi:alkylated DNA nucleotide flippase Atl1
MTLSLRDDACVLNPIVSRDPGAGVEAPPTRGGPRSFHGDGILGMLIREPRPARLRYHQATMNHRVLDRFEAVVGGQVWHFGDFATTAGSMRVGGRRRGRLHPRLRSEAAARVLRRCWRGETAEPDRSRQNASLAQREEA